MNPKTIRLLLPEPHAAQKRVFEEARRFNVLCCGRRWGKTVAGQDRLIKPALEGKPVAWFAPIYRQLQETWRELQNTLQPVIVTRNADEHRLELLGGGVIDMFSLDSSDVVRGRKYASAVIDEAAAVPHLQTAWQQAIRPCLADLKGEAWFLSTPRGFNYFKTLHDLGQDPENEDWASWQLPTTTNPYIDPDEIEAARADMTQGAFAQEFLAQFVDAGDSVFRHVHDAIRMGAKREPTRGTEIVFGIDWGRSNDFTAIAVVDVKARELVHLERFTKLEYSLQLGRVKALHERWKPIQVIAEANSIGTPVIEQLQRDGLNITPWTATNSSKAAAIEALALAFERRDIKIPNDSILIAELLAFSASKTITGLVRYSAPHGGHDDTVMALAIAWAAVSGVIQKQVKARAMWL
ncbi:MAG TPA: terminase family protein [Bryobacteraceae bacterium]|nr:terminase family protein [Bryobacteraceae bacterium]